MPRIFSVDRTVALPRRCLTCGHRWQVTEDLHASTMEGLFKFDEATYAELHADIDSQYEKLLSSPTEKVVCPRCGDLAAEAVQTYFNEGFRAGLKKNWSVVGGVKFRVTRWPDRAIFE